MMKRLFLLPLLWLAAVSAQAQNPYLPLWEHVPDGEPRVFEDPDNPGKLRAYIVGSHDTKYNDYCGGDVRMWSAPVDDLTQWRDEGPIFTWYVDGQWDTIFAPDIVEVKDKATGRKTYYLYPHSRGWQRVPMVCKSDRPNGPFTPINLTTDGRQCLPGSPIDFDPGVLVEPVTNKKDPDFDKGFRAYAYYGFQHSSACELDQNTMYSVRPGTEVKDPFLTDEFKFFEASSIRQVGNKFVMIYSGFCGPEYGQKSSNSTLRYVYGDSPLGPWRDGGVLVDSRGIVPDEDGSHLTTSNAGHNTHGSLQEINGQWYVFYHRPPRGYGFARQGMVAPVKITWDKKKVADGGTLRIVGYDPYTKDNEWTASASDGMSYTGAEVTSEGFHIFGLPPYRYYSAGIACYMTGESNSNIWLQDNHDVWNNSMDLTAINTGGIVGFKYFGFGGLAKDTKGLKAFEGTKAGDGTTLHLNLTPGGRGAFRIHVMLDGPYDNKIWNGREIGVIDVAADAPATAQDFQVAVPAVEGLTGKHAIYLVAEGPEVEHAKGLFDLHGIGFSKTGTTCERPVVPEVIITADGQRLNIPAQPVFHTNANGYTETNHYQVYGRLTDHSELKATATDPAVQIEVGRIVDGRATVKATYKGLTKIFLIN